jgi:hypothetical protein
MQRLCALALALLTLFMGLPSAVFALRHEAFGNHAMSGRSDWAPGVIEVVNLQSRVYCQGGDGPQNYYYRGNARALEEALGRFARIKDEFRQVLFLPGPARTHSFDGKPVEFNWQLNVSHGRYRATFKQPHAILRVYIDVPRPRPVDAKMVEKWLNDLDSEAFRTRDRARKELAKLGNDAKPFFRAVLKGKPGLEKRRRIENLLDRLPPGYDVTDFEVPRGLSLVTVDDHLAQNLKKMRDPDSYLSGIAVAELAPLAPYSDKVVPAITSMLDRGKHEWVRRAAALSLAEIGWPARAALPTLKQGLNDPDVNIRKVFQTAAEKLEKAAARPGDAEVLQRKLAIAQDIRELKRSREKFASP